MIGLMKCDVLRLGRSDREVRVIPRGLPHGGGAGPLLVV